MLRFFFMRLKNKWLIFAALFGFDVTNASDADAQISCGGNCDVPASWDDCWAHRPDGYATNYVRDLGEEMSKKMHPPIDNWNQLGQGYLSPTYPNYAGKHNGYDPPMYRRHVGWDNRRPDNTPVYAITTGRVTFKQYVPDAGYNNVVIIREKKNGVFQDRFWTYGHVEPSSGIEVGVDLVEGQQVGVVDQYDSHPHMHLTVHSTNWQGDIVDPMPPTEWGQHWGIARGVTQDLARWSATTHTVHPIHAYALYKGYDVTVGNDTTPPAPPGGLTIE